LVPRISSKTEENVQAKEIFTEELDR